MASREAEPAVGGDPEFPRCCTRRTMYQMISAMMISVITPPIEPPPPPPECPPPEKPPL